MNRPMNRPLTYLACPYSNDDPNVREERFYEVTRIAAYLINCGHIVYSPITHCHVMERDYGLPGEFEFWRTIDKTYISLSNKLVVAMMHGWAESDGVRREILIAHTQEIPVLYLDPTTMKITWTCPVPIVRETSK
jgi:hypothetical protein